MIWLVLALAGAQETSSLDAAYAKEYAYLLAERDGLQERLTALEAEANRSRSRATGGISGLTARLEALRIRTEQAEESLLAAERAAEAGQDADDALAAMVFQAGASLDQTIEATTLQEQTAAIETLTAEALTRLDAASSVTRVPGAWFVADGSQAQGELVRLGEIGTWGVNGDGIWSLIPAGEDRMVARGDRNTDFGAGVFLHEGRSTRIDERPPRSWSDVIRDGGAVGIVILALGALALLLSLLRAFRLLRAGRSVDLMPVLTHLREGRMDEARRAVSSTTSIGRVVGATLAHGDLPLAQLTEASDEAMGSEAAFLDGFGAAILLVAAVSPLLGLLGTVTGMIATFEVITEFGTGDPRMLSGGISAALVTTQLGLVVAIPALLIGHLLGSWAESIIQRASSAATQVVLERARAEQPTQPLAAASK